MGIISYNFAKVDTLNKSSEEDKNILTFLIIKQ